MRKIGVADYTLRQLSGDSSVSLLFREKAALAAGADSFGADVIELPALRSGKEDAVVAKTIASRLHRSRLTVPAGVTEESILRTWECISGAVSPCLQIALPVSTVQMEYLYHIKAPKLPEKAAALIRRAKELCPEVEFAALDATRADRAFLCKVCAVAAESGADRITLCDDAGDALPEEMGAMCRDVLSAVTVPVWVQVSDGLGLGAANALAAVEAGAEGVKTCVTGKNVLTTSRLAEVIRSRGEKLGIETGLRETEIRSDIEALLKTVGHADDAPTGTEDGNILLDAESSLRQVSEAASALGYTLSEGDLGKVQIELRRVCGKKLSVGARELEALIAASAMQVPSTYHLESFTTTNSNLTSALAHVVLRCGEELLSGVASGDGPIDAAFMAIEQSMGHHYELDDFQLQSVTEGREALGSALVRLRNNGKLYSGNGLSTDIVGASIRAYINALNKIVFEER